MSNIRKGDLVEVVTGPYKGERGKVLTVLPDKQRLLVEGINLGVKHERVRPNKPGGQTGGIVEREMPIHVSNVQYVDPKTGAPVRLGAVVDSDGVKKRATRGPKSSNSVIEDNG
ncbi:50S ribosomal protein L24 [Candidatus Poribacteria bacterium]|nr:50S ribosomal protein L24 [Candidatus Poribacteria bacterium]